MDKVIDIEERIPTLRERRKKRTNRKFVLLLLIFLMLLAALIYSQTKYSEIQDISISGALLYEEDEYLEESGLAVGQSMWSFSEKDIEEKLGSLEWVDKSVVTKDWLSRVEIDIKEYAKIGYLDTGTGYQTILTNGYALEKPVSAIDGPILTNFEDDGVRTRLIDQLVEVDSEVYNLISQILLTSTEEEVTMVILYMTDGNEVRGVLSTLAEKLNYYPSVTAQLESGQKGVIDMEVGIFFRSFDDVYGPPKAGAEDEESEPE